MCRILLAALLLLAPVAHADLAPASWNPVGTQDLELFGASVAPAGDVNHDGYGDVLVGAPGHSQTQFYEGRVFLFLGGPNGLAAAPAWSWSPGEELAAAGTCVAPAGDVNDDGVDDFLVGAPNWDSPFGFDAGGVFVFLGVNAGLPASTPWDTLFAGGDGAHFGASVATAGDIDGDLIPDVIVGAPFFENGHTEEGAAFVFLADPSTFPLLPSFTLEGNATRAHLGTSVSGAGDVNGDGYADIIMGAPGAANSSHPAAGRVFVYRGSASGIGATLRNYASLADSANMGASVGNAGDVNGDGYADIVIGSSGVEGVDFAAGIAQVYLGGATGPAASPVYTELGIAPGERFGSAVATAGDLDGDGYADVLLGGERVPSPDDPIGRVLVALGGKNGPAAYTTLEGPHLGIGFAASVATTGDVNGDGYAELLVGAPTFDGVGAVYEWIGQVNPPVQAPNTPLVAAGPNTGFGGSLAILPGVEPSINLFPALLIGEGVFGAGQAGRAHVLHGAWGGLAPLASHTYDGTENTQRFGGQVANAGDVNRDGYTDFVIGSPGYDGAGPSEHGKATLYLGSPTGPTVAPWLAEGVRADDNFGSVLSGGGDFNGDGYHDVVIGAPSWDSQSSTDIGGAWAYPGSSSGLDPATWFVGGTAASQRLGFSAAIVGDLDADGYSDIAVGSYPYPSGPGKVEVHFGAPGGPSPTPGWTISPPPPWTSLFNVAAAGDWNGDGVDDLLVGSPFDSDVSGTIAVYSGSRARSQPASPMWFHRDAAAGLGLTLAGGGDLNGDGYADVVAGEPNWWSGEPNEGRLLVFYGRPLNTSNQPRPADLSIEANVANYRLGTSLAPLGDINDDGFADIVAGSYDGTGRVHVWLGGGDGVPLHTGLTEWNSLSALRWSPARVNAETRFGTLDMVRTAAGRSRVSQRLEVRLQGEPFTGISNRSDPNNWDTLPPGAFGSMITAGLSVDAPYKATTLRVRRRTASASPYFPRSRWLSPGARAMAEYDIHTAGITTGVPLPPPAFGIASAIPNPARAGTTITFTLAAPVEARLDVFAVDGRHVRTLARGALPAGPSSRVWDGLDERGAGAAPGVYFVFLRAGAAESRTRVVLLP